MKKFIITKTIMAESVQDILKNENLKGAESYTIQEYFEPMMRLTEKQQKGYEWIVEYIEVKKESPALEEIQKQFSLSSINSVCQYLKSLEKQNLINRKPHQNRGIVLINK